MSGIKIETPWTIKAVTTAEVKTHLRIDAGFTDDDTYIDTLIESAQNVIEIYLNRSITTQTLSLYLDRLPFITTLDYKKEFLQHQI